jgi:hypothetical protein
MATIDDLLKYKKKVLLRDQRSGKDLKAVWLRVLGDKDLQDAFKFSRIASANKRKELRDKENSAYQDEIIGTLEEAGRESWEELILASKENEFANTAPIITPREDEVKIEEIAVEPDAPTLEEQERLDATEAEQDDKFRAALEEYIQTKLNEVKADLKDLTDEKVFELAAVEYVNVQSLQEFMNELNNQKVYRATYSDDKCTERAFSSIDAYRNSHGAIKAQLIGEYLSLEMGADDVKN